MRTKPFSNFPATSARTLYVSASHGRSHSLGTTEDAPLASLRRAVAWVHEGRADRLLLRRGDVFDEPIGRWTRSGVAADAPVVIGAYGPGDGRPVVRSRGTALELAPADDASPLHDVLVSGIHFLAAGRDPDEPGFDRAAPAAAGVWVRGPGVSRVTFDDCRVEQYDDDVLLDAARDVTLRRCLLLDAAPSRGGGPAHHLAAYGCGGVRVDACVFDQNAPPAPAAGGTNHHHVFVPHGNDDVAVTNCVAARSPGTALFLAATRNVATGNLLIANRLHVATGGASAAVSGNVMLGGRDDARTGERRGAAAHALWATSAELVVERNVIAHRRRAHAAAVVIAGCPAATGRGRARVAGNTLYRCGGGVEVAARAAGRLELVDNDLQRLAAGQPAIAIRAAAAAATLVVRGNRYDPAEPGALRFRLGGERLLFDAWAARAGDASAVARVGYPGNTARLPRRFIADARAQAGRGWRAHLSAEAIVARYLRAFHPSR